MRSHRRRRPGLLLARVCFNACFFLSALIVFLPQDVQIESYFITQSIDGNFRGETGSLKLQDYD